MGTVRSAIVGARALRLSAVAASIQVLIAMVLFGCRGSPGPMSPEERASFLCLQVASSREACEDIQRCIDEGRPIPLTFAEVHATELERQVELPEPSAWDTTLRGWNYFGDDPGLYVEGRGRKGTIWVHDLVELGCFAVLRDRFGGVIDLLEINGIRPLVATSQGTYLSVSRGLWDRARELVRSKYGNALHWTEPGLTESATWESLRALPRDVTACYLEWSAQEPHVRVAARRAGASAWGELVHFSEPIASGSERPSNIEWRFARSVREGSLDAHRDVWLTPSLAGRFEAGWNVEEVATQLRGEVRSTMEETASLIGLESVLGDARRVLLVRERLRGANGELHAHVSNWALAHMEDGTLRFVIVSWDVGAAEGPLLARLDSIVQRAEDSFVYGNRLVFEAKSADARTKVDLADANLRVFELIRFLVQGGG